MLVFLLRWRLSVARDLSLVLPVGFVFVSAGPALDYNCIQGAAVAIRAYLK
jgi:hypothetical protein